MRKTFLIFGLVLGLVLSWSMVWAEDFYVIPVAKKNYAPVAKTGQTGCWDSSGTPTICAGTGQDGRYQKGVHWPTPRFTANVDNYGDGDGTVTDNLTGLVWLKDASCSDLAGTDSVGSGSWTIALSASNTLADGTCGLSDGSSAGDWRLPNVKELLSLIDYGSYNPPLPSGHPFTGVQYYYYWSSTTRTANPDGAWCVGLNLGSSGYCGKGLDLYVWPVRGGQ